MPIREYKCPFCGKRIEWLERKAEDKPKQCPRCKAKKLILIPSIPSSPVIR